MKKIHCFTNSGGVDMRHLVLTSTASFLYELLIGVSVSFFSNISQAQNMGNNMMGQSSAMSLFGMGPGIMILSGIVVLTIVSVLAVFLIRRS
ncbi:MAG: hypothetical protein SGJ18_00760 [Pseudomonadota bacterium]|nr:hypothetical protein [Pseudomonadota bacterium]